jgi:hypothetical protein
MIQNHIDVTQRPAISRKENHDMTESNTHLSKRAHRAPRAAAVAGILFAVLLGTSYALLLASIPADSLAASDWLENQAGTVSLALGLLPFAGIAFLWFMGVVRDRLGHLEDQFFSTLFFGSGLLYLAMSFASTAIAGAVLIAYALEPDLLLGSGTYVLARAMIYKFNNVYALRMAGMHMTVLGTIWVRTKVMPWWLAVTTYVLALVLIVGIGYTPWLTMVFPAWVFLISVYILVMNYRIQYGDAKE